MSDQTLGKTQPATPAEVKKFWQLWEMMNGTEGINEPCRHCGGGTRDHPFNAYLGVIYSRKRAGELDTEQAVCFTVPDDFAENLQYLERAISTSLTPVWFHTDGWAFRISGPDSIVKNVFSNPWDPATNPQKYWHWDLYFDGMTVDQYLAADGEWADLVDDIHHKRVNVDGPDVDAGPMTKGKFDTFHTRWLRSDMSPTTNPPASYFKDSRRVE